MGIVKAVIFSLKYIGTFQKNTCRHFINKHHIIFPVAEFTVHILEKYFKHQIFPTLINIAGFLIN